jgi:hypothetical protein
LFVFLFLSPHTIVFALIFSVSFANKMLSRELFAGLLLHPAKRN